MQADTYCVYSNRHYLNRMLHAIILRLRSTEHAERQTHKQSHIRGIYARLSWPARLVLSMQQVSACKSRAS